VAKIGLTENAGVENMAPSELQGWKTREWKTRHQVQGRIQDLKLGEAKESRGQKSPSGIQKQSPGRESGDGPRKLKLKHEFLPAW